MTTTSVLSCSKVARDLLKSFGFGMGHPVGCFQRRLCQSSRRLHSIYSALAITTALTLRAVFRLALRQTEGLIGSIMHLLGLDLAVPDHSTLSRRAETLELPRPRPGSEPVHLLVDSTGLL